MSSTAYNNEIVWIIGASSGIGHALAIELAACGATLVLSARRKEELEKLKERLGARHMIYPLDVSDTELTIRTAKAIHAANGRIDRVIFMSAAYTPMQLDALDMLVTRHMIEVNLMGAFNVVHATLPLLKEQPSGQIALCGSVAGYTGLAGGQPYSATKAAVMNMAESLKAECPLHIDVKLISPGFVRTPLTDKNNFSMPMIITPEAAAKAIAKGLRATCFEIHFPKRFTRMLKLLRVLPYRISFFITKQMNA
jgi:short-subunit dehydrogenase